MDLIVTFDGPLCALSARRTSSASRSSYTAETGTAPDVQGHFLCGREFCSWMVQIKISLILSQQVDTSPLNLSANACQCEILLENAGLMTLHQTSLVQSPECDGVSMI